MSDDLDDLKAAMQAATPAPDATRKAANLALAQENFNRLQGSTDPTRLNTDRQRTGGLKGVFQMIGRMNKRGALVASTALVAVGLAVVLPQVLNKPNQPQVTGLTHATPSVIAADRSEAEEPQTVSEQIATDDTAAMSRTLNESAPPQPALGVSNSAPMPVPQPAQRQRFSNYSGDSGLAPQAEIMPAPHFPGHEIQQQLPDMETYPQAETNPLKITAEEPVSTFSIDVDTASYSIVRSSLMRGQLPPKGAVRVEEMVNYFAYDYPRPEGEAFRPSLTVMETPWNPDTQLVHIGIQGDIPMERPPLNLVFLIDTSGSMQAADKLPLLKASFRLLLDRLEPNDEVAIVTYAGSAGQVLTPTKAADRETILAALDQLEAGGSTAGQAGLQQAYSVVQGMAEEGDVTRVILATDGDFNVGISDPGALKDYISDKRRDGTYLSVLGFGRGNLDDATMQALAQNGNGFAAYIDTMAEAQKVLSEEVAGALVPIANDVKIQVEFNPAQIAEYRLIGYETRNLRREDFNNDRVDAGDIGAGHQVTAIYEITPVGSPARLTDPLRYQPAVANGGGKIGFLRLRYKRPGESESHLIEQAITATGTTSADVNWSVAMAGFAQLLRGQQALGDWSWADALALATDSRGHDPFGYRAEALRLLQIAASL